MHYPADMTAEDIMEFEYEYNRYLDLQDPLSLESVNAELQELANEEREMDEQDFSHDELERDHDERYEHEINDDWYDEQFEVDYSDF